MLITEQQLHQDALQDWGAIRRRMVKIDSELQKLTWERTGELLEIGIDALLPKRLGDAKDLLELDFPASRSQEKGVIQKDKENPGKFLNTKTGENALNEGDVRDYNQANKAADFYAPE